ncbi:MAG: hypothetical protein HY200_04355 [Nitrospirae bacterium]|nr:hypothetical protein [Nitrospirota bacterium]MBI3594167.1 hypothetical protein [Nitrospirota bacterium]
MKSFVILCLIISIFSITVRNAHAADDKSLENIFRNAYYGAAIGGLLGTAIMIFSDRPADHFNYIAYGLAGGVIAGTFYGMAYPSRGITDMERGRLKIEIPRPEIKYVPQVDTLDRKKAFLFIPFFKYHF